MDATEQLYRRPATIEQSEDGPQDFLVTITGGNCRYRSVDDGAGGFAWAVDSNDCVAGCAECLAVDSAEFIAAEHDAPTGLGETLDVPCTDCGGPRWNGKVEVPSGDGLRTSTTRLIRNIQRGEATAPELGDKVWVRQYFGQWVIVGNAATSSSGSSGACGCCDCLDCVASEDAEATDCAECANGAMTRYSIALGTWAAWPELGGTVIVTQATGACVWKSRLLMVRDPVSGCRGFYQYTLTQAGIDSSLTLAWVSGEDPLELDTAVHVVEWRAVAPWSCLCASKMQAVNGELFPSPSGLNCQICVVPYVPPSTVCDGAGTRLETATFAVSVGADRVAFTITNFNIAAYDSGTGYTNSNNSGVVVDYEIAGLCEPVGLFVARTCVGSTRQLLVVLYAYSSAMEVSRALYYPHAAVGGRWQLLSVVDDPRGYSEYPETLDVIATTDASVVTSDCDPDDCCDGDCTYTSIASGGGFTWQASIDTCTGGCAACPTVDAAFITEHGAPTALGQTLTVACAA